MQQARGDERAVRQPARVPAYELIVVSYQSKSQVEGLLAGLPDGIPLALVDNASGADGLIDLARARPNTRYLDGGGRGFAAAANRGARDSAHEYVVFVNPDCRPRAADLDELVAELAADPTLASSAATLVGPDGRVQLGTGGWEPTLRRAAVHAAGLHKIRPQAGLFARPTPNRPIRVDWTTGACMAVRRSTFVVLGGFDERFFVYSEDVAFGRAVRESRWRQSLRTDVLVPHGEAGSGAPSAEMLRLRGSSMARYVAQHNRTRTSNLVRGALTVGYLARVARSLLAGDEDKAREHLSYVQGVVTARASVGGVDVVGE